MTLARCCPLPTSRWLPPALVGMSAPHWTDSCNGGNSDISERTVHGLEYSLKTSARNWVSLNYPDGKKPKVRRVSHVTPDNLPPGGGDKFSPLAPNSTAGLMGTQARPAPREGACHLVTLYTPWTLCRALPGCGPGPPAGASAGR